MRELTSLVFGIAITTACGGRLDESTSGVAAGKSPSSPMNLSSGGSSSSATSLASGGMGSATLGQLTPDGGNATSGGASSIVVPGLVLLSEADFATLTQSSCAGMVAECELSPVARVFVVDLSDAMAQPREVGSNWDTTRNVLLNLIASATTVDLPVQLNYFPNRMTQASATFSSDPSTCIDSSANLNFPWAVPSAPIAPFAYASSLGTVKPLASSGSPIHDAYRQALELVMQAPPGYAREVVLVTAGRPTLAEGCMGSPPEPVDPEPIIEMIADAHLYGKALTTVIGTWGSQADSVLGPDMRGWLSKAARAGGTAQANCSDIGPVYCHLDLTAAPARQPQRLPTTAGCNGVSFSSCTLADTTFFDTSAANLQEVVIRDDRGIYLLPRNESKDCEIGWRLSTDGTSMQLCDTLCSLWLEQAPIGYGLFTLCPTGQSTPTL